MLFCILAPCLYSTTMWRTSTGKTLRFPPSPLIHSPPNTHRATSTPSFSKFVFLFCSLLMIRFHFKLDGNESEASSRHILVCFFYDARLESHHPNSFYFLLFLFASRSTPWLPDSALHDKCEGFTSPIPPQRHRHRHLHLIAIAMHEMGS